MVEFHVFLFRYDEEVALGSQVVDLDLTEAYENPAWRGGGW